METKLIKLSTWLGELRGQYNQCEKSMAAVIANQNTPIQTSADDDALYCIEKYNNFLIWMNANLPDCLKSFVGKLNYLPSVAGIGLLTVGLKKLAEKYPDIKNQLENLETRWHATLDSTVSKTTEEKYEVLREGLDKPIECVKDFVIDIAKITDPNDKRQLTMWVKNKLKKTKDAAKNMANMDQLYKLIRYSMVFMP